MLHGMQQLDIELVNAFYFYLVTYMAHTNYEYENKDLFHLSEQRSNGYPMISYEMHRFCYLAYLSQIFRITHWKASTVNVHYYVSHSLSTFPDDNLKKLLAQSLRH